MRMSLILSAFAAVTIAGCATPPHKIQAVANAGPCTSADRAELAKLSREQSEAVTADAVGVVLIGVPVASLVGKDREAEIAILKGRCG